MKHLEIPANIVSEWRDTLIFIDEILLESDIRSAQFHIRELFAEIAGYTGHKVPECFLEAQKQLAKETGIAALREDIRNMVKI